MVYTCHVPAALPVHLEHPVDEEIELNPTAITAYYNTAPNLPGIAASLFRNTRNSAAGTAASAASAFAIQPSS